MCFIDRLPACIFNVFWLPFLQFNITYYSACVAAVKCRPVLHHCVVIFFWSSGIIDCMFVYIWKWSSAHALGASVVWHHSLPLMNSFNKTEAAVFSCRLCLLRAFPFISLILHIILTILTIDRIVYIPIIIIKHPRTIFFLNYTYNFP